MPLKLPFKYDASPPAPPAGGIEFVGSTHTYSPGPDSQVVSLGTVNEGDLIIITVGIDGNISNWFISQPGYTYFSVSNGGATGGIAYKIAGTSEPDPTVNWTTSQRANFHASIFSGVDQSNPYVQNNTSFTGTAANTATPNNLSGVAADNLFFTFMVMDGTASDNITDSPPEVTTASVQNTSYNGTAYVGSAYSIPSTTGDINPGVWTHTPDGWSAASFEFKAA